MGVGQIGEIGRLVNVTTALEQEHGTKVDHVLILRPIVMGGKLLQYLF